MDDSDLDSRFATGNKGFATGNKGFATGNKGFATLETARFLAEVCFAIGYPSLFKLQFYFEAWKF
jgi:hypothetical protein